MKPLPKRGSIRTWPESERPRERLLAQGPQALTDAQILAILLRTGGAGQSALDVAHSLLQAFGGIRELGVAAPWELCQHPGVGPAKAAQLLAAFEIGRRVAARPLARGRRITTSRDLYEVVQAYLPHVRDRKKETFFVVLLDGRHQFITQVQVSEGTLNASLVHPREVFSPAIRHAAAAVVLLHNHPSGDPTPSPEDIQITRRLVQAGELLGIRVLDHLILGDRSYASLVDLGLF